VGTPTIVPPPAEDGVKVQRRPRVRTEDAQGPEGAGHARRYGQGDLQTKEQRRAGGAAGAMLTGSTASASDQAMDALAAVLRLGGDKPKAKVKTEVAFKGEGARSNARATERDVEPTFLRLKNVVHTTKLSSQEAVTYLGIAIAIVK